MPLLRSDRFAAIVLLAAAAAGLAIANSPLGAAAIALRDAPLGPLTSGHWIQDALLAVFFFAVAVELRHELTHGDLDSLGKAAQPAIAAAGGVIVPIGLYLALAGGTAAAGGWPIPTATDIAFALGVLAAFGRGIPAGVRVFLLALAILDDVVGIVFIAVLFTSGLAWWWLLAAVVAVAAFALATRRPGAVAAVAAIVLAVATWILVWLSGVHPTIAGVALGLAMAPAPALRVRHALEPWVNVVVLPLFALSAALVVIPAAAPGVALWAVAVALPVGKLVGIAGAGWLGQRLVPRGGTPPLPFADLVTAGALGGIGFTVSLLLAELALHGDLGDQATLGVLVGSAAAIVAASLLTAWRARVYRRRGTDAAASAIEGGTR